VLREDMPESKRALATIEGVTVYANGAEVDPLTTRKMELWEKYAGKSEAFDSWWNKVRDAHTRPELREKLGVSEDTITTWDGQFRR